MMTSMSTHILKTGRTVYRPCATYLSLIADAIKLHGSLINGPIQKVETIQLFCIIYASCT